MKKLIFCYLLIPFLLSSCVYSDKHELSDEEKDEQIIKLKDDNLYLKASLCTYEPQEEYDCKKILKEFFANEKRKREIQNFIDKQN